VRGRPTSEQIGLVRCYLRALSRHDKNGLLAIAYQTSAPVRITRVDFAHSADVRAGTATVAFLANPDDTAYYTASIDFADGVRESVPVKLANPSSPHSLRLEIGTLKYGQGPPATKPGPPHTSRSS